MLSPHDHYLPPDHDAFLAAEPPTGRVLIIAPTRAACETIEIGLTLDIQTYLEQHYGQRVRELAQSGAGFGIVAGTGTGKTLAVRPIAEEILRAPLHIGVVNREREATPELPSYNVIVITTGIARRWFQDGDILPNDTLVIDEIHQTSAELELCLALGKRVGCRFIWLSATVDPNFYREYLNSADVLEVYSFDPAKAAAVRVVDEAPLDFLDERFARRMTREDRGVGVFLPTRAGVEAVARELSWRAPEINAAYYHGGEPVRVIRPFLEDEGAPKPFLLAMTAAGQSALNVRGLDTVVIEDARFSNVITRGRNVLTRQHLGANEILQMAGRVHGRVEGGRVFILSNRAIDFANLRPTAPEFQLAGDSERVALTCADLGVRADELELPVPLDKLAYRNALEELQKRGIIARNGRLSKYGKAVESLPTERAWAELIVNADAQLLPYLAVMSSIESLHRMTREERNLRGLFVEGSDHLTAYNLYAEAFQNAGYVGEVYGMPRHLFESEAMEKWAQDRGVLVKSIEDAALATACLFRGVNLKLPDKMPLVSRAIHAQFVELLARWTPFDLAIDETLADGSEARVGRSSMCGPEGAIAGELRYFADRHGVPRASIEGTQLPLEKLKKWAKPTATAISYDAKPPRRAPNGDDDAGVFRLYFRAPHRNAEKMVARIGARRSPRAGRGDGARRGASTRGTNRPRGHRRNPRNSRALDRENARACARRTDRALSGAVGRAKRQLAVGVSQRRFICSARRLPLGRRARALLEIAVERANSRLRSADSLRNRRRRGRGAPGIAGKVGARIGRRRFARFG